MATNGDIPTREDIERRLKSAFPEINIRKAIKFVGNESQVVNSELGSAIGLIEKLIEQSR